MAFRKHERCNVSIATFLASRILLLGFMGCGLLITGCGGSSDTSEASSDAGSSDDGAAVAMSDSAMADSGMSDPAMSGSGMESDTMIDPASSGVSGDPALDPSTDPASYAGTDGAPSGSYPPGSELDPASDPANYAATAGAPGSATDPASDPANYAATTGAPGSTSDPASDPANFASTAGAPGSTSDPASDPANYAATAGAPGSTSDPTISATGEPGSANDPAAFGEGAAGPGAGSGEGGGAAQAKEPPADSPDYPAFKVVMGLMEGKYDGLNKMVSTRGRGLIEKIRSGSLTKTEQADLKKTFASPKLVGQPRTIRGSRTVTLNNGTQLITLVSKKQGSDWKVSSISIRAAKKR